MNEWLTPIVEAYVQKYGTVNTPNVWEVGSRDGIDGYEIAERIAQNPNKVRVTCIEPNPEQMAFKVPANPTSEVFVYGYLYRNATFSTGELKVELFLPGTALTSTPDDTYTLATTTGAWMPWVLKAYNPSTDSRYAIVRIRAKTATAGAYAYLDDLYDAGTSNKVAGLDLWDEGHISEIMVASDFSVVPELTRLAVWSDTDTYAPGSKGGDAKLVKILTIDK